LRDDGLDTSLDRHFVTDIHLNEHNIRDCWCFAHIAYGAETPATLLGKLDGGGTPNA